jgi:hypothetical protein
MYDKLTSHSRTRNSCARVEGSHFQNIPKSLRRVNERGATDMVYRSCRGPYLVWSPCGLPECPPITYSFPRRWFATLHALPVLHQHQREGDMPTISSERLKAFLAAQAGSSVRDASECHLRITTVSVGRWKFLLSTVQYIDRWGKSGGKRKVTYGRAT